MALIIETRPSAEQTSFNLMRWNEILADHELARLAQRIETDRHGHILMSPPPAPLHGKKQALITALLAKYLPEGVVVTECPISTSDGIKAPNVVWLAPIRSQEADSITPLTRGPDICIEIMSPGNATGEIEDKRALYFGVGAEEVWICNPAGKLQFYCRLSPETPARSLLCPDFPTQVK